MTSARWRHEEGSSVVLALVFLSVFGVLIATVLTFTESSLRISARARIGAESVYRSDGAVDAAINLFAADEELRADCPSSLAFELDEAAVLAACTEAGAAARSDRDVVGGALVAYGTDPDEGVRVGGVGGLVVGGDVHSNSAIATDSGALRVFGDVSAVGTCTGVVSARPGDEVDCLNPSAQRLVPIAHPAVLEPVPDLASPATVPNCDGAARTVSFAPGFYDDAAALDALTGPSSPCAGKVLHFQPGSYYFDFAAEGSPPTWTIDLPAGASLVGGQPAVDFEDPELPAPLEPGSCLADGASGVQLVFGGDSRLSVQGGAVELCGVKGEPVIYGLAGVPPQDRSPSTALSVADGPGETSFGDADAAKIIDGATTAASLDDEASTASITLDFLPPAPLVPAGARIDSVALRVSHRQAGDLDSLSLSVTVTPGVATAPALPPEPFEMVIGGMSVDLHEDQLDLSAPERGLNTVEQLSAGLTVELTATSSGGDVVEHLDGIELAVAYTAAPPQPLVPDHRATVATSTLGDPPPDPPDLTRATFATPGNATAIDGTFTADATLADPATTASIDLIFPAPALPAGARIEAAELRFNHSESDPAGTALSASVTPGGTGSVTTVIPDGQFTKNLGLTEDRIDLVDLDLDPEALKAGMSVSFTATRTGADPMTEFLDGIELALIYTVIPAQPLVPDHRATVASSTLGNPPPDPPDPTRTTFTTPESATAIDGTFTADATLADPAASASIDLVFPAPALPAGARIETAELRVSHFESDPAGLGLSASVTPGGTGSVTTVIPDVRFTKSPTLVEDRIDLAGLGLDPDALEPGMTVSFTAIRTVGGPVTELLDGIELALTYTVVPLEALVPDHQAESASTSPQDGTTTSFANETFATAIDGTFTADAFLTGVFTTASISLVFPEVELPAGAIVDAAALRVAHVETSMDLSTFDLSGAVTPAGAGATVTSIPSDRFTDHPGPEPEEDRIDLGDLGADPADLRAGMTVDLSATRAPGGADVTVELDGIELAVTYTLPHPGGLRAPDGKSCHLAAPYDPDTPEATCPLLDVSSGATVRLHGPVYAPLAAVDLAVVGESVSLDRGAAARTVFLEPGPGGPPRCSVQGSSSPLPGTRTVEFETPPPEIVPDDPYVRVAASVVFTDQQAAPCDPVTTTSEVTDWTVGAPGDPT